VARSGQNAVTQQNELYYGDNLDVLKRHIKAASVDLVYLDPPFNSNRNYNVLFAEQDGTKSAAQMQVFGDTWQWDQNSALAYQDVVLAGGAVSEVMQAFRTFLGESDMLAYLSMMAPRLMEMRLALKETGSLYLHCDPTASHYLKLLLDAVFGPTKFRSEIVWKRSSAHNDAKQGRKNYGHLHDVILFYTKSDEYTWNTIFTPYDEGYVKSEYKLVDEEGRRFRRDNLTAAKPGGDTSYEWPVKRHAGVKERWVADLTDEYLNPKEGWEYKVVPPYRGRFWAYSRENMRQFATEGRLRHTFDGMPEYKRFLDEMPGVPLQDLWTDITPLIAGVAERLGYPTQKPQQLLERIISASSNEGDVVLDPFCGCGTTIEAATALKRKWIGIDITHLAITLIKNRIKDAYQSTVPYKVLGEPTSISGAEELAATDKYQFQWWALGLVGARPVEQKKGADKGIDGQLLFHDGTSVGSVHRALFSVKGGHLKAGEVRDLVGTVERERAQLGVLISFEKPTKLMRAEAASHGFYQSAWGSHPKIQLITVEELLEGKAVDMPNTAGINKTFKTAPKASGPKPTKPEKKNTKFKHKEQHDLL
jgi:DNA modification methylase